MNRHGQISQIRYHVHVHNTNLNLLNKNPSIGSVATVFLDLACEKSENRDEFRR